MSSIGGATVRYLAALTPTSAFGIQNIALGIIGTFTLILLAARSAAAYADDRHGRMVTLVIGAAVIFFFCYFPDQTITILKSIGQTFFGGQ